MQPPITNANSSIRLLIVLACMFALPVFAKTWSAHGAYPALATGILTAASVFMGPVSLFVAGAIPVGVFASTFETTGVEMTIFALCGAVLIFVWQRRLARGALPYLAVTCWGLMGVYAPIMLVFAHLG